MLKLLKPDLKLKSYLEHLTALVLPPLEIDRIVPKKEVFSVPQFGQGPYETRTFIKDSLLFFFCNLE